MKTAILPQIQDIEVLGGTLELSRFYLTPSVCMAFPRAPEIFAGIPLGGEYPITYSVTPLSKEEYRILARKDQIVIAASDGVGLMYALFTLSELALQNDGVLCEFDAFDKPSRSFRAFSDDLSRGLVPTTGNLLETVRRLARYKYNTYLPYMEDTFRYAGIPALGRDSDPIGREEWKAVIAYAREWNLQIRPVVNLLGHFDKSRYREELQPLLLRRRDGTPSDVLDPRKPEVRELIRRMLRELADCFGPGIIHCGGDEPIALTETFGRQEAARLYLEHFSFVHEELQKRGCRMMLYADYFAPCWGDYSVPVGKVRELPPDTQLVFWDYVPRAEYPALEALRRHTDQVLISPAVRTYDNLSCDLRTTYANVRDLCRADAGRANGMIVSAWVDAGMTLREYMWGGVAVGANFAWMPASGYTYEECFAMYHKSFFGFDPEQAELLEPLYQYATILPGDGKHRLEEEFWRDPFVPVEFSGYENAEILQAVLRKAEVDLSSLHPQRHGRDFEAFALVVARLGFLAEKVSALPKKRPTTVEQSAAFADGALRLAGQLAAVRELHRRLWHVSNREAGWPQMEAVYLDLEDRLRSFARNARLSRFFDL